MHQGEEREHAGKVYRRGNSGGDREAIKEDKKRNYMKSITLRTHEVQAILEGRKTQTHRVLKASRGKQAEWLTHQLLNKASISGLGLSHEADGYGDFGVQLGHPQGGPLGFVICPYGQPGDILWVRETFQYYGDEEGNIGYLYKAKEGDQEKLDQFHDNIWRPSIHMPKEAARIFLRITDIRVERMQDITEEDAISEGIEYIVSDLLRGYTDYSTPNGIMGVVDSPIQSFRTLWESINGPESWTANPWAWCVSFERIDKPE